MENDKRLTEVDRYSPLLTFYELRWISALGINLNLILGGLIHLMSVHIPKLDVEPVTEMWGNDC